MLEEKSEDSPSEDHDASYCPCFIGAWTELEDWLTND